VRKEGFMRRVIIFTIMLLCFVSLYGKVLAVVGDEKILVEDILERMKSSPQFSFLKEDVLPDSIEAFVKRMVDRRLKIMDAKRSPWLDSVYPKYHFSRLRLLARAFYDEVIVSRAKANFFEVWREYNKRKKKVKLRQIVVSSEDKAWEVYRKLRKGRDFAELAMEYSEDASKTKGGDIGWFTWVSPKADKAIKKAIGLKPGKFTKPIKVGNQYKIAGAEGCPFWNKTIL